MNLFSHSTHGDNPPRSTRFIEIVEPDLQDSPTIPSEENIRHRSYRLLNENLHICSPASDGGASAKRNMVSRFEVCSNILPAKILELIQPEDPGRDAMEAIVRPVPRRGLVRPLDEDTRRFLQKALQSPCPKSSTSIAESQEKTEIMESQPESEKTHSLSSERSLAEELREAEEDARSGSNIHRELLKEFRRRSEGIREAFERERLGKLALSVEEDEGECEGDGLRSAARRLDALLAESRELHEELAGIHQDIQVLARRVSRRDP